MRNYNMEDLAIGMSERFNTTITSEMMDNFFNITGDKNPMHHNSDFARQSGFTDRIVYGMLTASLISTLGGCYVPGKNCLIQGVEATFAKPVYVGDTLTVIGKVVGIYPEVRRVEIKVTIKNQNGEKVLRGKLKAGVLNAG